MVEVDEKTTLKKLRIVTKAKFKQQIQIQKWVNKAAFSHSVEAVLNQSKFYLICRFACENQAMDPTLIKTFNEFNPLSK